MLLSRSYTSSPPEARTLEQDKPSLLVSWWCTGFALTIILFRLSGRFIRVERLIREDKIMALAIIPLLLRMGLVHVVMLWGTNNVVTHGLKPVDIRHREIGSRLVLVARIMYPAILWVEKLSLAETINRLVSQVSSRVYERIVSAFRWFLLATLLSVAISTIGECHPLNRAWQIIPDPGPACRLGYGQLATMGTTNIIADLILVVLPIPIIIKSRMTVRRKISLVLLFALSLGTVVTTVFRIPTLVDRAGAQHYRSLCASFEILVATAASNALALGSFVRDRGPKKTRFRFGSASDSLSRPSTRPEGRPTTADSDDDLARSVGMYLDPQPDRSRQAAMSQRARLPLTVPGRAMSRQKSQPARREHYRSRPLPPTPLTLKSHLQPDWSSSPSPPPPSSLPELDQNVFDSPSISFGRNQSLGNRLTASTRGGASFFDVGGLLEDGQPSRSMTTSPIIDMYVPPPVGQREATARSYEVDEAVVSPCNRSKVFLHDIGGLLTSERGIDDVSSQPKPRQAPGSDGSIRRGPLNAIRKGSSHALGQNHRHSHQRPASSYHPSSSRPTSRVVANADDIIHSTPSASSSVHGFPYTSQEKDDDDDDDDDDEPPYQPLAGNPVRPRRLHPSEVQSYSRPRLGSQPARTSVEPSLKDVGGLLSDIVEPI